MTLNTVWCASIYVLVVYFSVVVSAKTKKDCSLEVTNKLTEKFSPVVLYNFSSNFELVVPEKGYVNLKSGERITLACPGPRNFLNATHSNATSTTCVEGSTLKIAHKNQNFNEIRCQKAVRGQVLRTNKKCGEDNVGNILKIGYRIARRDFVTLINVCYDETEGNTLYTEHMLHGEAIKFASKSTYRPGFSTDGLGPDIAAEVAYKREFQKSTFNKLLKSSCQAEKYISGTSFLARGHLSPDADFLFATSQFTSYFYVNTCPQWQKINAANWKRLESAVRKAAASYEVTFKIITGTHDVLTLPDVNNKPQEIYLVSEHKLRVPKYVWKIMYNENTRRGIAFVILNNPFVAEMGNMDVFCENVCDKYRWGNKLWSNVENGFLFCCDVRDFRKFVHTVPEFRVDGVLEGIN